MSSNIILNVFIPHLFDPLVEWNTNFSFVPKTEVLVPLLNQLSEQKSNQAGFIDSLYAATGFRQQNTFPPHAISCYYYDFGKLPTEAVLLATPIHLQIGMSDVTIDGLAITDISFAESKSLQRMVNQHFKQDGLRLERSSSGYWYVLLPFSLMPETTYSVDRVLGNSLFPFLHHTQQLVWNRLLNELQMLLHTATVNQQRESQNLRSVSSFWLWGNSQCNTAKTFHTMGSMSSVQNVVAGGFDGKAFANALQVKWYDCLPDTVDGDTVVIIDGLLESSLCNDIEQWQEALARLEANYIKPLIQFCLTNKNIELIINTCDGRQWVRRSWSQRLLTRIKRRKISLLDYVI